MWQPVVNSGKKQLSERKGFGQSAGESSVHRVADGALVRFSCAAPEQTGGARRGKKIGDREFAKCVDERLILRVYTRGARIHRQCVRTRSSGWWRLFRTLPVRWQYRGIHEEVRVVSKRAVLHRSCTVLCLYEGFVETKRGDTEMPGTEQ